MCLFTDCTEEINSFHSETDITLNVCSRRNCYLESAILTVLRKGFTSRELNCSGIFFFSCLFVLKKATGKFAQENQEISQNSFCIHSISFLLKQDFDMHLKIVGFTAEIRLHWAGW